MPDKRKHRGKHPEDDRLFASGAYATLRTAVDEFSWLLTHGYATDSALKLVGDRHDLTVRQRMAVRRSACSDQALGLRLQSRIASADVRGQPLAIDGYNLLITVESALSGGLVLIGRDGCCRDLASVHGTYRKVEETLPALELIVESVASLGVSDVDWYLDSPVSNSGRLKAFLAEVIAARGGEAPVRPTWNIELVASPDALLWQCDASIVTSDSAVLDRRGRRPGSSAETKPLRNGQAEPRPRCGTGKPLHGWVNLAAEIIGVHIEGVWTVDLRSAAKRRPRTA